MIPQSKELLLSILFGVVMILIADKLKIGNTNWKYKLLFSLFFGLSYAILMAIK